MTRAALLLAAIAASAMPALASAQDASVEAALAAGQVGEQADGYLGFPKAPPADLRAKVDAINIKRRAAYTELAQQRGVSVQSAAAATACQHLPQLKDGRAFQLTGGGWQVKHGPIKLPDYCG